MEHTDNLLHVCAQYDSMTTHWPSLRIYLTFYKLQWPWQLQWLLQYSNNNKKNMGYIPVSYTHLDVYKRQVARGNPKATLRTDKDH